MKWLDEENGLEFRRPGIIRTDRSLPPPPLGSQRGILELWLQPANDDASPILCFYRLKPPTQFLVMQYFDTLLLQTKRGSELRKLEVEHVLHPGQKTFVAITSESQQTAVYIDGVLAERSSRFIWSLDDLAGQLVAGTRPVEYDSWSGRLYALAIYRRQLTPSQALEHYQAWMNSRSSSTARIDLDDAIALYGFDERAGRIVHNAAAAVGPNLVIPDTFSVPEKKFLEPPWASATLRRTYLRHVAINVAGFVPLGFFFYAFLDGGRVSRRISAALAVTMIGSSVSLIIELLQFCLPARDSSFTDVILNSFGTMFGVLLYRLGKPSLTRLKAI